MGDRGNIAVAQGDGAFVYLYSHWGGYRLGSSLQQALAKRWRWGQEDYLTRIIFDVMTENEHDTETGYGIGLTPAGDVQHPIIEVDGALQQVRLRNGDGVASWLTVVTTPSGGYAIEANPTKPITYNRATTFEDFLALADPNGWANPQEED